MPPFHRLLSAGGTALTIAGGVLPISGLGFLLVQGGSHGGSAPLQLWIATFSAGAVCLALGSVALGAHRISPRTAPDPPTGAATSTPR